MTKWITKYLGVKSAKDKLSKDEFGSIIVDLRDVLDDFNEMSTITMAFNRVLATVASARKLNTRAILQCEAGISRAPLFASAIFVFANDLEWEDAIELVKKKVPEFQVNANLLDSMKKAFGQVQ